MLGGTACYTSYQSGILNDVAFRCGWAKTDAFGNIISPPIDCGKSCLAFMGEAPAWDGLFFIPLSLGAAYLGNGQISSDGTQLQWGGYPGQSSGNLGSSCLGTSPDGITLNYSLIPPGYNGPSGVPGV